MDEQATDEALRAIAEPRRREILRLVAHEELAPTGPHRPHAQTGSTPQLHP